MDPEYQSDVYMDEIKGDGPKVDGYLDDKIDFNCTLPFEVRSSMI